MNWNLNQKMQIRSKVKFFGFEGMKMGKLTEKVEQLQNDVNALTELVERVLDYVGPCPPDVEEPKENELQAGEWCYFWNLGDQEHAIIDILESAPRDLGFLASNAETFFDTACRVLDRPGIKIRHNGSVFRPPNLTDDDYVMVKQQELEDCRQYRVGSMCDWIGIEWYILLDGHGSKEAC